MLPSRFPTTTTILSSLLLLSPLLTSGFEVVSPADLRAVFPNGGVPPTASFRLPWGLKGKKSFPTPRVMTPADGSPAALGVPLPWWPTTDPEGPTAAASCEFSPAPEAGSVLLVPRSQRCPIAAWEKSAAAAGAVAIVVVDDREGYYDAGLGSQDPADTGTGEASVFRIGRSAGLVLAEAIASSTATSPVRLRMFQERLSAIAVDDFSAFFVGSSGRSWSVPDKGLSAMLDGFADPSVAEYYKFAPEMAYRFCLFSYVIRCTPDGEISILSLTILGVHAALSSEIGRFKRLEAINAELSDLRAPLPEEIGTLPELRMINIGDNARLAGSTLPSASISRLRNLNYLKVASCGLSGTVPDLSGMPTLRILDLGGNKLTGPFPALGAASSTRLVELDVSDNQLTGAVDLTAGLAHATMLEKLLFSGNRLTGRLPAAVGSLPSLRMLWIQGNALEGPLPEELGRAVSLTSLKIGGGNRFGRLPDLSGLSALQSLDASDAGLEGPAPGSLPATLVELDLSRNALTSVPVGPWQQMRQLATLRVAHNRINATVSDLVRALPTSSDPHAGIQVLDARHNMIVGSSGPVSLATLLDLRAYASLREVRLAHNNLAGLFVLVAQTGDNPSLRVLDASHNPGLAGGLQTNLATLSLTSLDLRGTGIMQNIYTDGIVANPRGAGPEPMGTEPFSADDVARLRDLARAAEARAVEHEGGQRARALIDAGISLWSPGAVELVNSSVPVETEAEYAALHSLVAGAISDAFTVDGTTRYFDEASQMWCPRLVGAAGEDPVILEIDPLYHNHALCLCPRGWSRVAGNRCHPCPDKVTCPGLDDQLVMTVHSGYFPVPSTERPVSAVRCRATILSQTACNPDSLPTFACREGYKGRLCAECNDDHFDRNGLCIPCAGPGWIVVAVGVACLVGLLAILTFRLRRGLKEASASSQNGDGDDLAAAPRPAQRQTATDITGDEPPVDLPPRAMTIISILLFYTQTLSISMDGFALPDTLAVLKELYDLSNLSVTSLGARCIVGSMSFRGAWLLAWTAPLGIAAVLWAAAAALWAWARARQGSGRSGGPSGVTSSVLRAAGSMTLVLVTLFYFPMSTRSLAKLACDADPVTGVGYFRTDPAIPCDTLPLIEKAAPVALYPVLCYLVILMLTGLVYVRLRASRRATRELAPAVPPFARWFFLAFRDRYWYFAPLLFGRRLLVASLVSLVPTDNAIRYAAVAVVIVASAAAVLHLRPYRTVAGNNLDAIALLSSSIIYVSSFIAANDAFQTTDVLIILIVVLHLLTIGVFLAAGIAWARGVAARRIARNGKNRRSGDTVCPVDIDEIPLKPVSRKAWAEDAVTRTSSQNNYDKPLPPTRFSTIPDDDDENKNNNSSNDNNSNNNHQHMEMMMIPGSLERTEPIAARKRMSNDENI